MNLFEIMGGGQFSAPQTPMAASMYGNLPYLNIPQPQAPATAPLAQAPQMPQATAGAPTGNMGGLVPYNPYGMQQPEGGWNVYQNATTGERYRRDPFAQPDGPPLMPEAEWRNRFGR